MKKTRIFLCLGLAFPMASCVLGQNKDLSSIKKELEEINRKELLAFKSGDCETLMDLMDDNITFYANGNPSPPKKMIQQFCVKVPRPFGNPTKETIDIRVLNTKTGYIVRQFEYNKNDTLAIGETVTKIWNKTAEGWKMVHLQSTIKPISRKVSD